jgi:hypothetical protein
MRLHTKLILAALAATALLAGAVASASANLLSVSETEIEIVFDEEVPGGEGPLILESSIASISCPVTLLGHFYSETFTKEAPQTIGEIDHAASNLERCASSTGSIAGEPIQETLPWPISFEGWEGTLPNIEETFLLLEGTGIHLLNVPIIGNCNYTENIMSIAEPGGGEGWRIEPDGSQTIPGSGFCPSGHFRASNPLVLTLDLSENVFVTLI